MRKTVRPQLPAASAGILLLLLLVCAVTSVDGAAYYVQGQLSERLEQNESFTY